MTNHGKNPEYELIEKLCKGDEDSFRFVIDTYQKVALNTCFRVVNNRETAEDLVQEVFVEVYRSIKNFRGDSKLSTWIYRIAVTKSLDYLKKMKRQKRFAKLKSLFNSENEHLQIPAPEQSNPEKIFTDDDRKKILDWALNSLAENQRVAFTLSKYDELSYKEIADTMGTSVSSVESLIHRAKSNLKKKLKSYYEKNIL